jgi:hypothetical protein
MSARPVMRFLAVVFLVLTASAPAANARVFVSFGFPFFPFWGPAYYYPPAPAYYYPPPYYYPPQQSYYAPDAYANAPQGAPAPAQTVSPTSARNCRTYKGDATIDSSGRPFYGRACLEADGRWHVVQQ